MSFETLKTRLREEGWFVEWNMPCCQSCAWAELPYEFEDGTEVDFDKVLFNHSQDCEIELDPPEFDTEDEEEDWWDNYDPEYATPEQQGYSLFCFSGDKKGVNNLIQVLPIIEECGCNWSWDKTGGTRIEISWDTT